MAAVTQESKLVLDPLVAQPADTIDYMARREELRLTMQARYPKNNPVTGQREGVHRGAACGFRQGLLRLPKTGTVKLQDTLDGGESEELDVELVHKWLHSHRLFGNRHEGFWLVEHPAPPVSREELDRLLEAASNWDDETLQAILDQERAGYGREDLIRVAQGSLERIAAMRAQVAEQTAEMDKQLEKEQAERTKLEETLAAAQEMAKKAEARATAAEKKAAGK